MSEEEKIQSMKDAAKTWQEMAIALRDTDPAGSFRCFRWSEMMTDAAVALE